MEQENTRLTPEDLNSFYRTELTVLRKMCRGDYDFIVAVAKILATKDSKIEELENELRNKIYLLNKLDIDHE